MSDRFCIVEEETDAGTYYIVTRYNGKKYVPMYQNTKILKFRLKKMAEAKISALSRVFEI